MRELTRHDQLPGFWCNYSPPASAVAAEVQRPAHMVDGYTLAVAYMKDARTLLRSKEQEKRDA